MLGINTVSKGELSQMQEIHTENSSKKSEQKGGGVVKALCVKGNKGQNHQKAKDKAKSAKNDGKTDCVPTVIKSEGKSVESKEEIQDSPPSMEVSVHAIEGAYSNRTITLTGKKGNKEFSILVDGGSNHSFLDEKTAGGRNCSYASYGS